MTGPFLPGILDVTNPDPNWRLELAASGPLPVSIMLAQLVGLVLPRDIITPDQDGQLLNTDSLVMVQNNTGAPFPLIPPPVPLSGQIIGVKDAYPNGGNATSLHLTWNGTLDGQVNPDLVTADATWTYVMFWNGLWYRVG
jgi:hypothetical protein